MTKINLPSANRPLAQSRSSLICAVIAALAICATLLPANWPSAHAEIIRPIRFPIEGPSRFSNDFGAPRSGGRTHQGNDIFAGKLQIAVAATDGKISFARLDSSGNAGNMLIVKDAEGWEYSYLHMNNDNPGTDDGANKTVWAMMPGLRQGSRVVAGQPIAYVGDSGNAEGTAPHVHFEIHGPDDTVINPFESLQAASRAPFTNNHLGAASPFGFIDHVSRVPGGIRISGWSIDPDTTGPATVMAYPNGYWGGETKANKERGDLINAFPSLGTKHGFTMVVPTPGSGSYSTCIYGANTEAGLATQLGCPSMDITVSPIGSMDSVDVSPQGIRINGWAIDQDSAEPIDVHFYVDGVFAGSDSAKKERADLAAVFPEYGASHGYALEVAASEGFHTVCAYGINVAGGANSLVGCRWVNKTSDPWSNLDLVQRDGDNITVGGWAIDPDTASPIAAHVYIDGTYAGATTASSPRTDLAAAFPPYGPNHGFATSVAASPAPHKVCAYSINYGPGRNTLIGCKSV